ncbi:Putative heterokaryon incompatibility [Colletotrichum destructivum]|uniref:Heterokaryon incompatibility n=1 Tax=Colletotrichum destructivum TaxID=34406 RepID=A0AAX4I5R8_9PEZI|nr:Putative heterokaryon incompatibility [Colletotrichum destructivum]
MTEWHDPSCRRLNSIASSGISSSHRCNFVQMDSGTSPPKPMGPENYAIYQPLKSKTHIRLFTMEPRGFDDTIQCLLSVSSTTIMIVYDAFSYMWASENSAMEWTRSITLYSRTFLADAMCMNQEGIEERNHPVWLMPQIYSRTHRVLVHVGGPVQEEALFRSLQDTSDLEVPRLPLQPALKTLIERRCFSRA